MKLRARLALTVAATAVPVVAGLAWLRVDLERRAAADALRDLILDRMASGGIDRCEESPTDFSDLDVGLRGPRPGDRGPPGGRGPRLKRPPTSFSRENEPRQRSPGRVPPPRIDLFAYDANFVSVNPSSPPFPPELRRSLGEDGEFASVSYEEDEKLGVQIAMRLPAAKRDGPCAVLLARRVSSPKPQAGLDFISSSAIVVTVLLLAVVIAVGPVVRKVRRLTGEVRRSAADRYASPVAVVGRDEIAELAQAFNQAGVELRAHVTSVEKRDEILRSFVANTTHDVMLPLTVLQGHLTALRKRLEAGEPTDRDILLDSLEEAHYMASLIQNLGAAVKLESADVLVRRHPVSLSDLVERVVGRHKPIARQRNVRLEHAVPEDPVWTEGDVTLIEQAVSNVTHNAVRYNNSAGNVSIVLEAPVGEPGRFSIRVTDDGPGISEEALSKITERSFRTDEARRRQPDGLGLGLHIAKSVAQVHGFDLALRRSEFGGLEVELRGSTHASP